MIRPGVRRFLRLPIWRRRLRAGEVDDEIRFHLEQRAAQLVREQGLTLAEARAEALRRFGGLDEARARLMEAARQRETHMRRAELLDTLRQDLTYALRQLRRSPGFALAAVITLALGIGANATMFGVIDRLLLRPPAHVADPARVMLFSYVRTTADGTADDQDAFSYALYRDLLEARAFEHVAAYSRTSLALGRGADARSVRAMRASASYFATLGVRPVMGRLFLPEDDGNPIAPPVAVLGYGFWQSHFGGDPNVIGRSLPLGDGRYTVIGVAPERFVGLGQSAVDLWVPLTAGITAENYAHWLTGRQAFWLRVIGRLRPGVTAAAAQTDASAAIRAGDRRAGVAATWIAQRNPRVALVSALPRQARADDPDAKVSLLLGAVSFLVLLLACANVANLLLARGLRRRREIAVRLALGVGRGRLLRLLVLESVVLAALGGAAAVLVARWGGELVRRVLFAGVEWVDSPVDVRVLGYTALAALATGLLAGLAPALQASNPRLTSALKEGTREGRVHRSGARRALLLVQAALTVVLLVGTGLFVRSLRRIEALPLGMNVDRVLVATMSLSGMSYKPADIREIYRRFEEVARATPGVRSVAVGTSLPFATAWAEEVKVPGRDSLPLTRAGGPYFNAVTPDFFDAVGTRVLRGRGFTAADRGGRHRVVVVNETLARLWWPGESPLGRCMKVGGDTMPCAEVVGVVENARRFQLIEDESVQFFIPIEHAPAYLQPGALFVRAAGDPSAIVGTLRRQLQSAVPNLPPVSVEPFRDQVSPQTRSWRLGATMFGAFGMLALALAAVGLYGVLAYDVSQRTHEMGVRVALGAQGRDVSRLVVGEGLRVAVLGGTIGFAVALAAGRFVAPLLFRTSPREPVVFGVVGLVLLVVALLATLIPAWRAARVDPVVALRTE
ncbi:MAG: ADOP family duplicated permease [Gemmatimonadota bacterium]|nr:ADOP family duplicated permease [Gemmatimonadota bacterium]